MECLVLWLQSTILKEHQLQSYLPKLLLGVPEGEVLQAQPIFILRNRRKDGDLLPMQCIVKEEGSWCKLITQAETQINKKLLDCSHGLLLQLALDKK